jgi:hypothetical protein
LFSDTCFGNAGVKFPFRSRRVIKEARQSFKSRVAREDASEMPSFFPPEVEELSDVAKNIAKRMQRLPVEVCPCALEMLKEWGAVSDNNVILFAVRFIK